MNSRRSALVTVTLGLLMSLALAVAPTLAPTPAVAASPRTAPATSVLVERSGGFAGGTEVFVAGRGTGERRVARLLDLASGRSFRALHAEYLPENPCCDRYRYRVVVRHADGVVQTVATVDDAPGTPWVLAEVIQQTVLLGTTR